MKIVATFVYNNNTKVIDTYTLLTNISVVIEDSERFVLESNGQIDKTNLVEQWGDLYKIEKKFMTLRILLRLNRTFKICYNGYVAFAIQYENIEVYPSALYIEDAWTKDNNCCLLNSNIVEHILPYLSWNDIHKLNWVSKRIYTITHNYFINKRECTVFNTASTSNFDNNQNNPIQPNTRNPKEFLKGIQLPDLIDYQKKTKLYNVLGYYIGANYTYLLIQSLISYNVEIRKIKNTQLDEQEVIFTDEWTNYYVNKNTIIQIKYNSKKAKLNKWSASSKEEIKILIIKSKPDISPEYLYVYNDNYYIVTSNKSLYSINMNKSKLQVWVDYTKKYKKYLRISDGYKKRTWASYYKCIEEYYFISLNVLEIYSVLNHKELNRYPKINCVDYITDFESFYMVRNYNCVYWINKNSFDIDHTVKRCYSDLCVNERLVADGFINIVYNNYHIMQRRGIQIQSEWGLFDRLERRKLYERFNSNYLCYSWYSTITNIYIKLIHVTTLKEWTIQLNIDFFVNDIINENECVDSKDKRNIIYQLKPKILLNGHGDFVVNFKEYYWFYQHIDKEPNVKCIKKICWGTNLSFTYHNYIFTDLLFIIWSECSSQLCLYELNENKEMRMVSLDTLEINIGVALSEHYFIFKDNHENIYLTCIDDEDKATIYRIKVHYYGFEFLYKSTIKGMNLNGFNEAWTGDSETILYMNFEKKNEYLVMFSNWFIYICKLNTQKNEFEIKNKIDIDFNEHIFNYRVTRLKKDYCYLVYDYTNCNCLYYNISKYVK